jgi:hypothetical protein
MAAIPPRDWNQYSAIRLPVEAVTLRCLANAAAL